VLAGIYITINATVGELLTALGLAAVPPGCDLTETDIVEVCGAADEGDLIQAADLDDAIPPDQAAVMDLVAAIRGGNADEAEQALERLFGGSLKVREWVQQSHARAVSA